MINLKGGAAGRQSDAAKRNGFLRSKEVLQDSGSVCVGLKSQFVCGERVAVCVCVFVKVCVSSSPLEVTEGKALIKCMKGTVQVELSSTLICSFRAGHALTHLGVITQVYQSHRDKDLPLIGLFFCVPAWKGRRRTEELGGRR